MSCSNYATVLSSWGIVFSRDEASVNIEGSPERTAARSVIKDTDGQRWILEQIEEGNLARKCDIAQQLLDLRSSGLTGIHPWKKTSAGTFFHTAGNHHWMVRPFINGEPLDRKTYLNDSWRIDAMTDFLLELRKSSRGLSGRIFSIKAYAEDRLNVWSGCYSKLAEKLQPSFKKLQQRFFPVYDRLPVAFCHGDYHPLNMIWGRESIQSVIDWEFCGTKPELYDVALLLGCIGFDDPDYLIHEPALHVIRNLRQAGFGSDESWEYLLDLTAVIRYGWMSEWIRRRDREARKMEAVYIDILVDQKEYIQSCWNSTV